MPDPDLIADPDGSPEQLFSGSSFPSPREDETLYSWCSRYHHLSCNTSPHTTSRQLFRHPIAGLRHDIPFCLAAFEAQTQGFLGCALDVLYLRTVFGFHAKFLPHDIKDEIAQRFLGTDNARGRGKLGLSKAGQAIIAPLKYCTECSAEQRDRHKHTWWQSAHQIPTSYVCNTHSIALLAFPLGHYRGVVRNFYLPPAPGTTQTEPALSRGAMERLREITAWGMHIWRDNQVRLTDDVLRWCYRLQAKQRDWVAFDGSVRLQEIRDSFVAYYGEALAHLGGGGLGDLDGDSAGFLAYLFRQAPSRRYPLKHVILLNFLFENIAAFEAALDKVRLVLESDGPEGCEAQLRDGQAKLIRLVKESGQSLTKAASTAGTSISSAAKFIDKQGDIERERRPRIVGTNKERVLRELLASGASRQDIAHKAGVRRAFIKDYLAQHPDQRVRWEKAHLERETEIHRARFLAVLNENPGLPIKAVRRLPQNGFQWLYNNDRIWLQQILPAIWKR